MNPWNDAHLFTLENRAGLRIQVMDHGATWLSCWLPLPDGTRREVMLGCASLADYQRQTAYLGAIIGRVANRIAKSRFTLDGQQYQLSANEGPNKLHGGPVGFDRRVWTLVSHSPTELVLSLHSTDGDQGFPGNMDTTVRYTLGDDLSVNISLEAEVSAPCPVSLTSHAYVNLDGDGPTADARGHRLRIAAPSFLPVGEGLIPTGERLSVDGTGFDFRTPRPVGEALGRDAQQHATRGYDHAYWLDEACADGSRPAVELQSADGRATLQLFTRMPSVQFYSGNFLAGVPGRTGPYGPYAGLALEPQFAPDSPNHPEWPDCTLRPGQRYQQTLRYVFGTSALF